MPVLVGGRLPPDLAGRRVGEPDLLVAAAGGPGYRPVDIKHHRCLDEPGPGWPAGGCAPLEGLVWEVARAGRRQRADLMQGGQGGAGWSPPRAWLVWVRV